MSVSDATADSAGTAEWRLRPISSAVERLPYKQDVAGSKPASGIAGHHGRTGIWGICSKGSGETAIRAGAAQNALKPSRPARSSRSFSRSVEKWPPTASSGSQPRRPGRDLDQDAVREKAEAARSPPSIPSLRPPEAARMHRHLHRPQQPLRITGGDGTPEPAYHVCRAAYNIRKDSLGSRT